MSILTVSRAVVRCAVTRTGGSGQRSVASAAAAQGSKGWRAGGSSGRPQQRPGGQQRRSSRPHPFSKDERLSVDSRGGGGGKDRPTPNDPQQQQQQQQQTRQQKPRQERSSQQRWQPEERRRDQRAAPLAAQAAAAAPPLSQPRTALTAAVAAQVEAFGFSVPPKGQKGTADRAKADPFKTPMPQQRKGATNGNGAHADAVGATIPPRRQGVTDGRWDKQDELAVAEAVEDAKKLERQYQKYCGGEVILGRSQEELAALMAAVGQPAYRAKQLRDGVMQGARSVHDITTLSKDLRAQLAERGVRTGRSVLHHSVSAPDGTRKFLLQLADGRVVETVGIPADGGDRRRLTVCVSSQVGCPMRCTFCATGKGGFARNLLPHEIVDQVLTVQEQFGQRVSNVVFMGMGEPLLNLPSVLRAHTLLNKDVGIGARHITISTVGVPNAIARMARLQLQSTLAVSIHAPNQALREQIVPSARAYPLDALMHDCQEYFRLSGRRVTFEYTLLAGVNDEVVHAEELAVLLRRHDLRSHVNLIPWNPVDESEFQRPSRRSVTAFAAALERSGVPVSLRHTRGLEAAAACGQLRNMHQKTPLPEFAVPA